MRKIVECVPNFSEGNNRETIDAIARASLDAAADAAGRVTAIYVQEGQEVKVGEKLLSLASDDTTAERPATAARAAMRITRSC